MSAENDSEPPAGPTRREFLRGSLAGLVALPAFYQAADLLAAGAAPAAASHVRFLLRNDAEYARHAQIFNRRITAAPKVIAVCLDEKGVQDAVAYAKKEGLPIAVKSGGHCFEGFSTNDGGLMIDLSGMNATKYDRSIRRLTVQPGAKLGAVYDTLASHGRLIPAGSCAGVGVAGLTLGGGYGFWSRQFGLTCDSLRRVRLVDGKGGLHDSNDNPELLWACRGGGNGGLGIVTTLEFDTHPTPAHFISYRFKYRNLTPAAATQLAARWFGLMATLPNSSYSSWILNGKHLTILVTDTHLDPPPALRKILGELKTGATDAAVPRKDTFALGIKRYKGGTEPIYFKNVSAGYYTGFADLKKIFPSICEKVRASKVTTLLQINTLGGAINNPALEATGAYPHRKLGFLGELQTYFDRSIQEKAAVAVVRDIQILLSENGITAHYANYPDIDLPHWQTAYYGASYPRLQKLKRTLDPDDRIRHPQSVRLA
ncbi:MAG TPA: FAD-binding oxidoreductase [Thermoanaerobaculia bacterium]|jgi:FAD/FMN-containing dehydrogenase|nr:FAD-binding oxidoreductase [Thermoanaerobaculia bacterium]